MVISDWPIQGLAIDLLRRELYNSREEDWDFFSYNKELQSRAQGHFGTAENEPK